MLYSQLSRGVLVVAGVDTVRTNSTFLFLPSFVRRPALLSTFFRSFLHTQPVASLLSCPFICGCRTDIRLRTGYHRLTLAATK